MEKNKRKIRVLWWCSVLALALGLGASRAAFSLPDLVFYGLYGALVLLVLASWFILNQLWYREFIQTVNALTPILTEEGDTQRYIAENEKLLVGKKSAQIRAILRINLCMAHCGKGQYKEAQRQLEAIDYKKIHGIYRAVYWMDCAYVAFYLQEQEKAMAFMEQNRKNLQRLQNTQEYGGMVAVLRIFERLDRPEEAQELYAEERERWETQHNQSDFEYLEQRLQKALGPQ